MTNFDFFLKRIFDLFCAVLGLVLLWPVILVCCFLAGRDTGASGLYRQKRVGRNGKLFTLYKVRTMRAVEGVTVTTSTDARITKLGAKLRRYKFDEMPQLLNVLAGHMSIVGPRPDVPGFLDKLEGADRELLKLRPGITGPASLKYRNEEELLAGVQDPERYNATVVWPDKVKINLDYLHNWSFWGDIKIIAKTVFK